MKAIVVVNNPKYWKLQIPNVEVISAKSYLIDSQYSQLSHARIFNLCRSYRYQSIGYYVSLLASARGHKPIPSIETIQDMKSFVILRLISNELDDSIQRALKHIHSDRFTLSVYFGRNFAKHYDRLSNQLFRYFQIPFFRVEFRFTEGKWVLQRIQPLSSKEIPDEHKEFITESAQQYFSNEHFRIVKRSIPRFDLAILVNPEESDPPSDDKALEKFSKAAKKIGLGVEFIEKDDFGLIPQFDALFIRETTNVNHHTYRFAKRAYAEGLVVMDDPNSIERCTNKVFLSELLNRHKIPTPKSYILHSGNLEAIAAQIDYPCVVKKPDSAFSQGVYKCDSSEELHLCVNRLLKESELIVLQEFIPTQFDWRIGIIDRKPLYACRYHMAKHHWQIMQTSKDGDTDYGEVDTMLIENAPPKVVKTALKAANLIGDGLYGVDLKQDHQNVYIIEVNDNPSIESGYEDKALKNKLYEEIMQVFLNRIEQRKEKTNRA